MKSIFNIPEDEKVRLWNKYLEKTYEQIVKLDTALQDFGVGSGQVSVDFINLVELILWRFFIQGFY